MTHYEHGPPAAPYRPDSHLSSVAPRAPLPGYDRDYRNSAVAAGDPWGPTSPPIGGGSGEHAWGHAGTPTTTTTTSSSPPPPPHHFPTTTTTAAAAAAAASSSSPALVPRGPQTFEPRRTHTAAADYGPPEPAGGHSAVGAPPGHGQQPPSREAYIRIRILGVDRQKKDTYIKFNAEVSPRHPPLRKESR